MKTKIKALCLAMALTLGIFQTSYAIDGSDWDTFDAYNPEPEAMKSLVISGSADVLTTVIAIGTSSGTEANGLLTLAGDGVLAVAASAIILKGALIVGIGFLPEEDQKTAGIVVSDITWGVTANNICVIAGSSGAGIPVGIAVASYLLLCDYQVLPDSICF